MPNAKTAAESVSFIVVSGSITVPTANASRVIVRGDEATVLAEHVRDRFGDLPAWFESVAGSAPGTDVQIGSVTVRVGTVEQADNADLAAELESEKRAEADAIRRDILAQTKKNRVVVIRETSDPMTGQKYLQGEWQS